MNDNDMLNKAVNSLFAPYTQSTNADEAEPDGHSLIRSFMCPNSQAEQ